MTTIEALAYALGETERSYREVPNLADLLAFNNYPDTPELFGWGSYRKTEKDIFELGIESAAKSLAESTADRDEIDALFFCSTCFPGNEIRHIAFNARLLRDLAIPNAFPVGITLSNCVSLLHAVATAVKLVDSGVYRNILVITADKVYDEHSRMNNFALLSDSAASCVVTSKSAATGCSLLAESFRASDDPIETNRGKDDSELYRRVLHEVVTRGEVEVGDCTAVFTSNIFKPITKQKERKLGFRSSQIFLDNVPRYGHCFSADTLINLIDYSDGGTSGPDDIYMLSADAPNLRASILLKPVTASGA